MALNSEVIKLLDIATKTLSMYSEAHPRTKEVIEGTFELIHGALAHRESVTISTAEGNLLLEGQLVEKGNPVIDRFARDLFTRNIHSLTLCRGITKEELVLLLHQLNLKPQRINELGGFEKILQQEGIKNVQVNKVKYGIITGEEILGGDQALLSELLLAVQSIVTGSSNANRTAESLEKSLDQSANPDPAGLLFRIFQMIAQKSPSSNQPEHPQRAKDRFVELFRSFTPAMQAKLLYTAISKGSSMEKSSFKDFYRELSPEELEKSMLPLLEQPISEPEMKSFLATLQKDESIKLTKTVQKKIEEMGFSEKKEVEHPALWEELLAKDSLTPEDMGWVSDALGEAMAEEKWSEADRLSKKVFAFLGTGQPEQKIAAVRATPAIIECLSQNEKWKNVDFSISLLVSTCFRKETNLEVLSAFLLFLMESLRKNLDARKFSACHDLLVAIRSQSEKREDLLPAITGQLPSFHSLLVQQMRQGGEGAEIAWQYLRLCQQEGAEFLLDWLAEEEEQRVRASLIGFIERFSSEPLLPLIEKRMSDPRWYVVRNMITILGKLNLLEMPAFVRQAALHSDPRVAKEIIKHLYKSGSKANTDPVLALLQHVDKSVRLQAIHLVTTLSLQGAVPVLLRHARTAAPSDTDLRALAFQALLKFKAQEAVPLAQISLEKKATGKTELAERNAAVKILGEMSREQARPLLEKIAQLDPNSETRALAASYL